MMTRANEQSFLFHFYHFNSKCDSFRSFESNVTMAQEHHATFSLSTIAILQFIKAQRSLTYREIGIIQKENPVPVPKRKATRIYANAGNPWI